MVFSSDADSPEKKAKRKDSRKASGISQLKWIFIVFVTVLVAVAAFFVLTSLNKQDSTLNQKPEKQTVVEERETSEKPKKKAKKKKSVDPLTSITNNFDKSILKELTKAQSVLDKGQIEDALKKFEGLVNKYPKSPLAMYGKAQSLDKLSEMRQSNEILQQSIHAYGNVIDLPDCPLQLKHQAMRQQADRLSFLGKIGQAISTLKKLLNLFPHDLKLMNEIGVQYLLSGRNRDAENIYNKVCWRIQVLCSVNKLTSVFYACGFLLMINCLIKLSKWLSRNHEPLVILH